MDNKGNDHYRVGQEQALAGLERYKFRDPHLQKLYDEGYDSVRSLDSSLADQQKLNRALEQKVIDLRRLYGIDPATF